MIDLYYWPTPNGWKVSIMLEETGLPYRLKPVNIGKGEQFSAEFLAISPNHRMPAILDPDGPGGSPISLFESGAILCYLGDKTRQFFPEAPRERHRVLEWLFWQVGGLGPMAGQVSHFVNYAPHFPGDHSYSETRYKKEFDRLLGVMERVLAERQYLAGDYSIADMASFPWVTPYKRFGQDLDKFANVRRWYDAIKERPAVRRGMDLGKALRDQQGGQPDPNALKTLFGQTSEHARGQSD